MGIRTKVHEGLIATHIRYWTILYILSSFYGDFQIYAPLLTLYWAKFAKAVGGADFQSIGFSGETLRSTHILLRDEFLVLNTKTPYDEVHFLKVVDMWIFKKSGDI